MSARLHVADARRPPPSPSLYKKTQKHHQKHHTKNTATATTAATPTKKADVFVPEKPTYDDFVRVSKEFMKGRTPAQQTDAVLEVLRSLMPPGTPAAFRCVLLLLLLFFPY